MRNIIAIAGLMLIGCGDPDTNDDRGYTKAPLERPTVLVQGEPDTEMDRLGDPVMVPAPVIKPEAEAKKSQTAAPRPARGAGAPPAGATAADVTAGEQIFSATGNCFTCHGQNGAGTAMAPALNDQQWVNVDGSFAALQQIINSGVAQPKQFPAAMPAKGGAPLTDQQVKQVAAYVYSISR